MMTAVRVALPIKGRSQARYWHGALLHRQASCQQRACFASSKVRRLVTTTIPPTGADANEFYGVSAPNVVPFVVTNRTGKRNRAGRVPVVGWFVAACRVAGWCLSANNLAFEVEGWFVGVLPGGCAH
jgi:hypothetical protein